MPFGGQLPDQCRGTVIALGEILERPSTALARKLANVLDLSLADRDALDQLGWNARKVQAHTDIISDGDRPAGVNLIMSGWACRYKMLNDGSRQITAVLMPGDFCDLHITIMAKMDHGIAALCPVTVARVSRRELDVIRHERPAISIGLDWMTMVDLATLRAWMTSLGQTQAVCRVAHLMCELYQRSINIGHAQSATFPLPMTQVDIADATAQTSVHV
ncbi:MAG: Crp/Fnr family transcriptional regulator, partial [Oxalobacteraceae bacterium]